MFIYDQAAKAAEIEAVIAKGPYTDTWESLSRHETPRWFRDAKLGIFIHWGVFAVPSFHNEWYSRNMYVEDQPEYAHHREVYGDQKEHGYRTLVPLFTGEKFDAAAWVSLFKKAGARYVVPVAEHHDGFQMYRSALSHWNAVEKGPHRDIIGELTEEECKQGLYAGASTHRIEHWWFMDHGRTCGEDAACPEEYNEPGGFYWPAQPGPADHTDIDYMPDPSVNETAKLFLTDWMIRTCEIVDRYAPSELYFDWWIQETACKPYLRKILAYYYNRAAERGQEVLVAYKRDACAFGTAVVDVERGQFADVQNYPWQTDTAIAKNSWCYTTGNDYKKPWSILCDLCDVVSKNGTMLLNVGPKPDGTFSEEDTAILTRIGAWLSVNGEAVYGSRPWKYSEEGPTKLNAGFFSDGADKIYTSEDYRFTTGNGALYAICLRAPEDGHFLVKSLAKKPEAENPCLTDRIRKVEVLGSDAPVRFDRTAEGLAVETRLPAEFAEYPVVLKISVE